MDSAAVIVNPVAGRPGGRLSPEAAARPLRAAGFSVEILCTTAPGEAADLAARAAERHPVVAAAGGDGTMSEICRGLAGTGALLALLPCGSGNDFATGLGIRTAEAGAAAAAAGNVRRVDLAWCGAFPFVNSAGFLLSGEVSRRAARLPRGLGALRYRLAALAALARHRPATAIWTLEGLAEPLAGEWSLAEVGNGALTGGGFRLTPDADCGDGRLDFCLARGMGRLDILRLLPRSRSGAHLDDPRVVLHRAASARVEFPAPFAVHLDGEAELRGPGVLDLRVDPGALRVLAPPPEETSCAG